jgi:hypothetical protein
LWRMSMTCRSRRDRAGVSGCFFIKRPSKEDVLKNQLC